MFRWIVLLAVILVALQATQATFEDGNVEGRLERRETSLIQELLERLRDLDEREVEDCTTRSRNRGGTRYYSMGRGTHGTVRYENGILTIRYAGYEGKQDVSVQKSASTAADLAKLMPFNSEPFTMAGIRYKVRVDGVGTDSEKFCLVQI